MFVPGVDAWIGQLYGVVRRDEVKKSETWTDEVAICARTGQSVATVTTTLSLLIYLRSMIEQWQICCFTSSILLKVRRVIWWTFMILCRRSRQRTCSFAMRYEPCDLVEKYGRVSRFIRPHSSLTERLVTFHTHDGEATSRRETSLRRLLARSFFSNTSIFCSSARSIAVQCYGKALMQNDH